MLTERDIRIIRKIEKEYVDEEYKKYKIIYRANDLTIPLLLKFLGDFIRDLDNDNSLKLINYLQRNYLNSHVISGVEHCFRWLSKKPAITLPTSIYTSHEAESEIKNLIGWAIQYSKISINYVAWSRGLIHATLHETKKHISFAVPEEANIKFIIYQSVSEKKHWDTYIDSIPYVELKEGFPVWIKKCTFEIDNYEIPWNLYKGTSAHSAVLKMMSNTILPELPYNTNLGDYTLGEFRKLFTALFINFTYYTWVEDYYDKKFGSENIFGSSPVCLPEGDMVSWLSEMSDVDKISIKSMLQDLIFDVSNFHSKLVYQPFIASFNNIYTLPRLIARINPARSLTGALNKGNKKKIYDRLICDLEQANLLKIQSFFNRYGFTTYKEKKLTINGKQLSPDLLIFDEKNNDLLILDYKHFLAPLGASEVAYKMSEAKKGIKQVKMYFDILSSNKEYLEKLFGKNNINIYGLLLFRWPTPIPLSSIPEVNITDWLSLQEFFSRNSNGTIQETINWIQKRDDLNEYTKQISWHTEDISVGNWTISTMIASL
ncbi:hypothetical protein [Paenibacillus sp. J2TS4]|uniref:hypothetical protein n=1 Tax=Paenibacillus sp. J2TS4 TaxID=2807194 RepID=UPI001B0FCC3E|nr:hypothetical protein [Paenibacillus sp. J2TS4]GIP35968.1 hypothetical protein J2TS4_51780 [Paenibacillus sp. J2TS4]